MEYQGEDRLWHDAWLIAYIGASNPIAVANTLAGWQLSGYGDTHPAMRNIAGHLAFLRHESLGPDMKDLDELMRQAALRGWSA